jgi:hypothetical protein
LPKKKHVGGGMGRRIDVDSLICSLIVNVTVTQYTSAVNGVSLPTY